MDRPSVVRDYGCILMDRFMLEKFTDHSHREKGKWSIETTNWFIRASGGVENLMERVCKDSKTEAGMRVPSETVLRKGRGSSSGLMGHTMKGSLEMGSCKARELRLMQTVVYSKGSSIGI